MPSTQPGGSALQESRGHDNADRCICEGQHQKGRDGEHEPRSFHVRGGFAMLDAGDIDEFELDDLIHRYTRAAKQLWLFCGSSGAQSRQAAAALAYMRERGEERDGSGASARRRDRL